MKKICKNCQHFRLSSRGGECAKVRGELSFDDDGSPEYEERMRVSRNRSGCNFYEEMS